jgi:hypothetical protein
MEASLAKPSSGCLHSSFHSSCCIVMKKRGRIVRSLQGVTVTDRTGKWNASWIFPIRLISRFACNSMGIEGKQYRFIDQGSGWRSEINLSLSTHVDLYINIVNTPEHKTRSRRASIQIMVTITFWPQTHLLVRVSTERARYTKEAKFSTRKSFRHCSDHN